MNHSWGENHKTTRHRSSHTNVHGIYSSISNEIASRIERKRGRAMVKANCSNYLCWKSKRVFLPAGSKQHGSKNWRRECTPFLPQVPTLLLLGHHFLAAGFHLGAVCCSLLLWEEILIWGIPWETCRPVGPAQWCCVPVLRSSTEPALVLHRSVWQEQSGKWLSWEDLMLGRKTQPFNSSCHLQFCY